MAVFGVVSDLSDLREVREVREVGDGDCGREGGMREGGPDGSPSEVVYYTK